MNIYRYGEAITRERQGYLEATFARLVDRPEDRPRLNPDLRPAIPATPWLGKLRHLEQSQWSRQLAPDRSHCHGIVVVSNTVVVNSEKAEMHGR